MHKKKHNPKRVHVLVDNDSWILPYAKELVRILNSDSDNASLCRDHADIEVGDVSFFLGCINIVPPSTLAKSSRNLVVHASDLPKGRGFSPWTWLILEGSSRIPVCLIDADVSVDSGAIIYKDEINLGGHELVGELRDLIGQKTIELCARFLSQDVFCNGVPQVGEATYYPRRRPRDSALDPNRTISEQFDLLRVVDNELYPAHFEYRGHAYVLRIEKVRR